jgi:hypothetical protein
VIVERLAWQAVTVFVDDQADDAALGARVRNTVANYRASVQSWVYERNDGTTQ